MKFALTILLFVAIVNSGEAWRNFMRGRRKNGNVGEPNLLKDYTPVPDQWFTQILDHSNPVDGRTWKQVT